MLPESRGLIFNLLFRKTPGASSEAEVVLVHWDWSVICEFPADISPVQQIVWDVTTGHPLPVYMAERGRGRLPLSLVLYDLSLIHI